MAMLNNQRVYIIITYSTNTSQKIRRTNRAPNRPTFSSNPFSQSRQKNRQFQCPKPRVGHDFRCLEMGWKVVKPHQYGKWRIPISMAQFSKTLLSLGSSLPN